jgi:outer membrane protein TolC
MIGSVVILSVLGFANSPVGTTKVAVTPSIQTFAACAVSKSFRLNQENLNAADQNRTIAAHHWYPSITTGLASQTGTLLESNPSNTGDFFLKYSQTLLNFAAMESVNQSEFEFNQVQNNLSDQAIAATKDSLLLLQQFIDQKIQFEVEKERLEIQNTSLSYLEEAKSLQIGEPADYFFAKSQMQKTRGELLKIELEMQKSINAIKLRTGFDQKSLEQIYQKLNDPLKESADSKITDKEINELPAIKALVAKSNILQSELKILRQSNLPSLNAEISYNRRQYGYDTNTFDRPDSLYATATISLSLTEKAVDDPKRTRILRDISVNEESKRRKLAELKSAAEELQQSLETNQKLKALLEERSDLNKQSYRLSLKKFNFGKMSYLQLKDVESELLSIMAEKKKLQLADQFLFTQIRFLKGSFVGSINKAELCPF